MIRSRLYFMCISINDIKRHHGYIINSPIHGFPYVSLGIKFWMYGLHLLVDSSFPLPVDYLFHYSDVIMSAMASQITSVSIICSTIGSGVDRRKHHSSGSLAFVQGNHRRPVNSLHKGPVTRKMFPFGNVIMSIGSNVKHICNCKRPPYLTSHLTEVAIMSNQRKYQATDGLHCPCLFCFVMIV